MSNKKLIFGPSIFLVSIVFTMGAAVLNAPALLIYLLIVKMLYAFVVSMIVEGWRKNDSALVETSETRWNVNINGIPVTEVSNALFNLHFTN
ncbi:hypothetical protein [Vibrio sp. WXL210]|uniref:hypothetical protein n=1 Tax=Vibrio sp. WXL210 TaxID=3450709 RepID=UPI003EC6BF7C